jgi:halimadienyl-diphosphate synthase
MRSHPPIGSTEPRAIASTPYDTAWVAAVPHPDDRRDPRFPTALNWITTNQHPDGSWGSALPYLHDRIICTLAALIPLARFGRRELDRVQLRRGERYLWQHAHLLQRDPCELVGFELLLPTLTQLARDAGVKVPPYLVGFAQERHEKLKLLPPHLLYSPAATIVHSLEFLGAHVDPLQLLKVRSPNGSIGNSPAATAFLLHHVEDAAAVAYLAHCLASDPREGVPVLEPCETFETLWVAYHQFLGGTPASELFSPAAQQTLQAALGNTGVSLSPSFPVADADDTAVALILLHEAGIHVAPSALQQFEREAYFVSFPYERHASTGVNIHVLQALLRYPEYPRCEAAIANILRFLEETRQHGTYWIDKWHVSPYYATSRAVIALSELPGPYEQSGGPLLDTAVEWLVQTQHEHGAWGFFGLPTCEETAYALLALNRVAKRGYLVEEAMRAGEAYLAAHAAEARPALWIDKCLYHPTRIVDAAINAALAGVHAPSGA